MGSEYNRIRLKERLKKGGRGRILFEEPESENQRKFFEGVVCVLATFFQDNLDYRNNDDIKKMRDTLIEDALGLETKEIEGKLRTFRESSKGSENLNKVVEYSIDYLVSEFAIEQEEVLNPDKYKTWRDTIYPYGGPDNYIDYLKIPTYTALSLKTILERS